MMIINGISQIICGTMRLERPTGDYGGINVFFGLLYLLWIVVVILT